MTGTDLKLLFLANIRLLSNTPKIKQFLAASLPEVSYQQRHFLAEPYKKARHNKIYNYFVQTKESQLYGSGCCRKQRQLLILYI